MHSAWNNDVKDIPFKKRDGVNSDNSSGSSVIGVKPQKFRHLCDHALRLLSVVKKIFVHKVPPLELTSFRLDIPPFS